MQESYNWDHNNAYPSEQLVISISISSFKVLSQSSNYTLNFKTTLIDMKKIFYCIKLIHLCARKVAAIPTGIVFTLNKIFGPQISQFQVSNFRLEF